MMNKKNTKKNTPLLKVWINGETIYLKADDGHVDINNGDKFVSRQRKHRIKSYIEYRPYETADELLNDLENHKPYNFVKPKYDNYLVAITYIGLTSELGVNIDGDPYSFEKAFDKYVWPDGTPFGVLEK